MGIRFSLDEFFERISHREEVPLSDAILHAKVVMEVLQEALAPGEIRDIRSQLPAEYDVLFDRTQQRVGDR